MKQVFAAIGILGIVLMLVLSGCIEQKQEISKEKIESAMKNVKSYTVDANMSTNVGGMQISLPMTIKVDVENKKMAVITDMMGQKMELYYVGNISYINTFGKWIKHEKNKSMHNGGFSEIKCWKNLKVIGEEKVEGVDCYKISVDISIDCYAPQAFRAMRQVLKNFEIEIENMTYYIDKSTNRVKKEKFIAKMKSENIGGAPTSIDVEAIFSNYDKTVVELPEEAKNAKSMKEYINLNESAYIIANVGK